MKFKSWYSVLLLFSLPLFLQASINASRKTKFPAITVPRPPLPHNWTQPVAGQLSNYFGNAYHYFQTYRSGHTGVDLKAPRGTPVHASAAGKVVRVWASSYNLHYGRYLMVHHGPGLYALYGHLEKIYAKPGAQVKQGQVIASVGMTGAAGYPHLHFEVLSRRPKKDGAWGYSYICRQPDRQGKYAFLNRTSVTLTEIWRQYGAGLCHAIPLPEKIIYYNPEYFWLPNGPYPLHQAKQPENEELKYHRKYLKSPKPLKRAKKSGSKLFTPPKQRERPS